MFACSVCLSGCMSCLHVVLCLELFSVACPSLFVKIYVDMYLCV